jgi:hypothetical protein
MKTLTTALLAEQKKFGITPAVKIGIQSYAFPAESGDLRFSYLNWAKIHQSNSSLYMDACMASDGSLIIVTCDVDSFTCSKDYNTGIETENGYTMSTYRFPSPTSTTDFTSALPAGTPTGANCSPTQFCVCANPTSGEIIIFRYRRMTITQNQGNYDQVYTKSSADYGATWGAWTMLWQASAYVQVITTTKAAYASNGDLCLFAYPRIFRRIGGAWQGLQTATITDTEYYGTHIGFTVAGTSIGYDEDWFVTVTFNVWMQGSVWQSYGTGGGYMWYYNDRITNQSVCYGIMGHTHSAGTFADGHQINIADASVLINDLSDISHFAGSPLKTVANYTQNGVTWTTRPTLVNLANVTPQVYPFKLTGLPFMLEIHSADKAYFYELKNGYTLSQGTFSKAYTYEVDVPIIPVFNSTYLFGINAAGVLIAGFPNEWSPPTIGTGAGSEYNILTSSIVGIQASCKRNQGGQLIITFPNNDGAFNSPGSGSLSGLARGSRVDLYPGYLIGGVETTSEIQRFFVDDWNYSWKANYAMFTLVCDDAWALLSKYKFNKPIYWNEYTNATTAYAIIDLLVQSIGGTLTYVTRSTSITGLYPKIKVGAGETAAAVLLRVLALVPDVIKWFGNDATVIYPLTTDSSVYDYAFPQNDVYL